MSVPASPESPVAESPDVSPVLSKSPTAQSPSKVPLKSLPRPSFLLPTPPTCNPTLPFSSCSSLTLVQSKLSLVLSLFLVLFLILSPFH